MFESRRHEARRSLPQYTKFLIKQLFMIWDGGIGIFAWFAYNPHVLENNTLIVELGVGTGITSTVLSLIGVNPTVRRPPFSYSSVPGKQSPRPQLPRFSTGTNQQLRLLWNSSHGGIHVHHCTFPAIIRTIETFYAPVVIAYSSATRQSVPERSRAFMVTPA